MFNACTENALNAKALLREEHLSFQSGGKQLAIILLSALPNSHSYSITLPLFDPCLTSREFFSAELMWPDLGHKSSGDYKGENGPKSAITTAV